MLNYLKEFISSAFYNVLYMSIIGIFVGIFILIFRKFLDKKISPKWKCVIWLLLLISLVIPLKFNIKSQYSNMEIISLSGLVEPIQNISKSNEDFVIKENITKEEDQTIQKSIAKDANNKKNEEVKLNWKDITLNVVFPLIWFFGVTTNIILLILGNRNIKSNIKGKNYNNEDLNHLLKDCRKIIGVKKDVKIILQRFKKTPSIIGIIKPKILITENFLKQDYKTQKYIMMHELSHYKRQDLLFNYFLLVITSLHWFNPFIWLFFKKIRQDIELATDEIVLNKLEEKEKTEYGMTLIKSLKIFQNENYTAKLLCITDDNKNMERRLKMVKLSKKFNRNKIIIAIISIIIIFLGILLFFTENNNLSKPNLKNEEKFEYKAFKPTFKKLANSTYDDYDFSQDMIYKDSIYYKKINNYEEYLEIKSRWNDILDMNESDFENNFMLITAVENSGMLGLNIDKIETDNNNLYISLIHYEDGVQFDENKTCISYIISRDMERDNICVTRNLRNNEKDMSEELQLAEETQISQSGDLKYIYKDERYRELEKKISTNESNFSLVPVDWKDMIAENFTITKDMPEIDFSNWTYLGNEFYSIAITDYSEYLKMMNNYNVPKMSWFDFKYVYAIIIVRTNSDYSIMVEDITKEKNNSYLNVSIRGVLDVTEQFKYPAMCVYVPNYRSSENNFLNVRLKEEPIENSNESEEIIKTLDTNIFAVDFKNYNPPENKTEISMEKAREIAQNGFETSAKLKASEGANDIDSEKIEIKEVYANNYFISTYKEPREIYKNIKRNCFVVSRENEMGCGIKIYVDMQTGLIIGGEAYGD